MSKTAVGAREVMQAWGRILQGYRPNLSIEITKECPLRCPGCYAYGDEHLGGDDDIRLVHAPCNTELEQGFWCRTCATTFGPNAVRGVPKAGRRSRARKNP